MLDAIGTCSSVGSQFYVINEVSTVVSLTALQQYISPINETIGSPTTTPSSANQSSASTGIANAFALIPNLMFYGAGLVNASFTPVGSVGTVHRYA